MGCLEGLSVRGHVSNGSLPDTLRKKGIFWGGGGGWGQKKKGIYRMKGAGWPLACWITPAKSVRASRHLLQEGNCWLKRGILLQLLEGKENKTKDAKKKITKIKAGLFWESSRVDFRERIRLAKSFIYLFGGCWDNNKLWGMCSEGDKWWCCCVLFKRVWWQWLIGFPVLSQLENRVWSPSSSAS